jgi:hypothetical protein
MAKKKANWSSMGGMNKAVIMRHLSTNQSFLKLPHALLSQARGRAIAQAVSRWLPTAAAQVRARVWSSGICGGQSGAGAGFLRVLRFWESRYIAAARTTQETQFYFMNRCVT